MADDTPTPSDAPAKKPAARRRNVTPAKSAAAKPRATKAKADADTAIKKTAPPKPRSSKRATPKTTGPKTTARKVTDAASKATGRVRGKSGAAAIAGGLAAAGVAAAALFTLRGSSAKPTDPATPTGTGDKAHQPDGTDSSKSFQAGIADESTIPG